MRVAKGRPGYLVYKRKVELVKTIIAFALVLAVLFLGISQTGSRLNVMTIVAVLGALPASKMLVGVITRFPYPSIGEETAAEIAEKTENITVIYDMIITSREKIMPVDCIAISDNTICGYTHSEKVDLHYAATHIKRILEGNKFDKVSVKLFHGYKAFLSRAEGMNAMAAVEQSDTTEKEEMLKQIILNISM